MNEYALYKGDEFICLGTIKEIAEYEGVREDTIRFYGTRTYREKLSNRKTRNPRILIKIDKDEID